MSLYHIVFAVLAVGAVWEHIQKKTPRRLFAVSFLILTAMLCLRFGQGQDYFNYSQIFFALPANPLEAIRNQNIHSEPGWKVLCCLFKLAGLRFPALIFAVSAYMMAMFWRFLRLYGGERKMLALVLCYHTMYLTYFMSVLRQGIIIATLLGLLIPWLMKGKYIRYCIVVFLISTIHTVALLLLLLPIIKELNLKFKHMVAVAALGFLVGIVLSLMDVGLILRRIVDHVYLTESDVSIVALLERVATFSVVTLCYYIYLDGMEPDQKDFLHVIYKIYAVGVFLYGVLMWSALISSRTVYILKVIEIIMICACITRCKKTAGIVLCYGLLLSSVLYVKNIDSYLEQGQYQNATVVDYPYVSIFNQKDILNYRQDTHNYPFE